MAFIPCSFEQLILVWYNVNGGWNCKTVWIIHECKSAAWVGKGNICRLSECELCWFRIRKISGWCPRGRWRLGLRFPSCRESCLLWCKNDIHHPNSPDLSRNGTIWSLWAVTTFLLANSYFGSRSCLLDCQSFSQVSISCRTENTELQQLMQEFVWFWGVGGNRGGSAIEMFVCVWLIKDWVGGEVGGLQPDARPAAGCLSGRGATLKCSSASKVGLSQTLRGDNPYFICILLFLPTTCRATQHRPRAWIVHDTEIKIEKRYHSSGDALSNPTPWGALQSLGMTLLDGEIQSLTQRGK